MQSRFYLKIGLYSILGIVIASYAYYQSRNLIYGPEITITNPINGSTLNIPLVKIDGYAKNIVSLTLNDNRMYVDENGTFHEKLLLSKGYNIITIEGKDRFNRGVKRTLELVYD